MQLVRRRAIQMSDFLLLVSSERSDFGDIAQPRMRKRRLYTCNLRSGVHAMRFDRLFYSCNIHVRYSKQIKRLYCEIN